MVVWNASVALYLISSKAINLINNSFMDKMNVQSILKFYANNSRATWLYSIAKSGVGRKYDIFLR